MALSRRGSISPHDSGLDSIPKPSPDWNLHRIVVPHASGYAHKTQLESRKSSAGAIDFFLRLNYKKATYRARAVLLG
jgi:hypothetical protein